MDQPQSDPSSAESSFTSEELGHVIEAFRLKLIDYRMKNQDVPAAQVKAAVMDRIELILNATIDAIRNEELQEIHEAGAELQANLDEDSKSPAPH